jgi:DNA repair protein RadD
MSHPFTDVDEKKKAAALHMLRSMDPMRSTMINVCLAALDLVYVHGVKRDEITLRPYQVEAVESVFRYLREGREGNPLVEVPTGGGKSAILGEITRRLVQDHSVRVVVVTHRAELIEQDADAISRVWPDAPVGIYSASLSSRSVDKITVCGVQSVYRRHKELGKVDVVIVDEAHLVNVKSGTQYARLIEGLRERSVDLAVIGLTATPYRLGQGLLTSGEDKIFSSVCSER